MAYVHGSPTTGHFGIARTIHRIKVRFWRPTLRTDVSNFVAQCLLCELARCSKPPKQGKMVVYHPKRRFEIVAVDVLEISPKTVRGNITVVVMGDKFTRYAAAYPIANEKTETVARIFLDE